jgi:hypothetical protein
MRSFEHRPCRWPGSDQSAVTLTTETILSVANCHACDVVAQPRPLVVSVAETLALRWTECRLALTRVHQRRVQDPCPRVVSFPLSASDNMPRRCPSS